MLSFCLLPLLPLSKIQPSIQGDSANENEENLHLDDQYDNNDHHCLNECELQRNRGKYIWLPVDIAETYRNPGMSLHVWGFLLNLVFFYFILQLISRIFFRTKE